MDSIRKRLLLVLAAGFVLLMGGAGFAMESLLRERVTQEFDAALLARARALGSLTEWEGKHIELDYDPQHMQEFERSERPDYFQFLFHDGKTFRSKRLGSDDLPRPDSPPDEPLFRDARLPDGRAGRVVQIAYTPKGSAEPDGDAPDGESIATAGGAQEVVLVLARDRERLDALLANVRLAIFGAGGVAALLAVLLVWRALARGFRPIESIAAQVRELDADRLASRVDVRPAPRELAPVVEQLNALLRRLHASFERERRFAANVAHELRTPIAELRSLADVGARWPEDRESVVRFFGDVGDIAARMEGVVADLLLLARCEAGVEKAESSPADLREIVAATWSRLAPEASGRGLRFRLDVPEGLVVQSDPGKLGILVGNLLGNAVSYARPGSEIGCAATRSGDRFRLEIANAAEPLTPEDLRSLAEPFWRKDEARSSPEHAGLGLSVVRAVAALLGLHFGFDQDRDGTFRVRLRGRATEGAPGKPQPVAGG